MDSPAPLRNYVVNLDGSGACDDRIVGHIVNVWCRKHFSGPYEVTKDNCLVIERKGDAVVFFLSRINERFGFINLLDNLPDCANPKACI